MADDISKTFEFHPIANEFPLLEGEEFDKLVEDIRTKGLQESVVLFEEKILDGRNRYRACLKAGVDAHVRTYEGDDPIGFVISVNLRRRHLTAGQRAAIAVSLATLSQGGDRRSKDFNSSKEPLKSPTPIISQKDAAKKMDVSPAQVKRAAAIKKADPKTFEKVKRGEITVGGAAKKIRKSRDPVKKREKPRPDPRKPATAPDLIEAWDRASVEERQRFINNVGLTAFVDAIPSNWWDLLAKRAAERTEASEPCEAPGADLDLPDFLARCPSKAGALS